MIVKVWNVYEGSGPQEFRGAPEQVRNQLRVTFPWLGPTNDLAADVARLQAQQALFVEAEEG